MEQKKKREYVRSKQYPAVSLDTVINFLSKLKSFPAGKPIAYESVAEAVHVSTTTKSFKYTISAAKQFGLISVTNQKVTLNKLAEGILYPTGDIADLKRQCFLLPTIYQELANDYDGKALPPQDILENILVSQHGIAPKAKKIAAQAFLDTVAEIDVIEDGMLKITTASANTNSHEAKENSNNLSSDSNIHPQNQEDRVDNEDKDLVDDHGYEKLVVPFGQQKPAVLYVPNDIVGEDAQYLHDMISLMFKRLYGLKI